MAWYWYARDIKVTTLPAAVRAAGGTAAAVSWPVTVGMDLDYNVPELIQVRHRENLELVDALTTAGAPPGWVCESLGQAVVVAHRRRRSRGACRVDSRAAPADAASPAPRGQRLDEPRAWARFAGGGGGHRARGSAARPPARQGGGAASRRVHRRRGRLGSRVPAAHAAGEPQRGVQGRRASADQRARLGDVMGGLRAQRGRQRLHPPQAARRPASSSRGSRQSCRSWRPIRPTASIA